VLERVHLCLYVYRLLLSRHMLGSEARILSCVLDDGPQTERKKIHRYRYCLERALIGSNDLLLMCKIKSTQSFGLINGDFFLCVCVCVCVCVCILIILELIQ